MIRNVFVMVLLMVASSRAHSGGRRVRFQINDFVVFDEVIKRQDGSIVSIRFKAADKDVSMIRIEGLSEVEAERIMGDSRITFCNAPNKRFIFRIEIPSMNGVSPLLCREPAGRAEPLWTVGT